MKKRERDLILSMVRKTEVNKFAEEILDKVGSPYILGKMEEIVIDPTKNGDPKEIEKLLNYCIIYFGYLMKKEKVCIQQPTIS